MRLFAVLLTAMILGCASTTSLERAQTLGKGGVQLSAAVGAGVIHDPGQAETGLDHVYSGVGGFSGLPLPSMDLGVRFGVGDRFDLSAALSVFGLGIGGKVLFTEPTSRFSVSFAPSIRGRISDLSVNPFRAEGNQLYLAADLTAPVLLGFQLGDDPRRELVLSPKLVATTETRIPIFYQAGGGVGVILPASDRFSLGLEAALLTPIANYPSYVLPDSTPTARHLSGPPLLFNLGLAMLVDFAPAPRAAVTDQPSP